MATGCKVCGEPAGLICSRCRESRYCDRSCQKVDWVAHKPVCNPRAPPHVGDSPNIDVVTIMFITTRDTFANENSRLVLAAIREFDPQMPGAILRTYNKTTVDAAVRAGEEYGTPLVPRAAYNSWLVIDSEHPAYMAEFDSALALWPEALGDIQQRMAAQEVANPLVLCELSMNKDRNTLCSSDFPHMC